MNLKMKSIIAVVSLSAAVFAAETAAPAVANAAPAAPTATTEAFPLPADAAPAAEAAAPVFESATPVAAPAAETAEASDESAPVAVRGENATAAPSSSLAAEMATVAAPPEAYPVAVRENALPSQIMYVVPNRNGAHDTVTLDQLRGFVPMEFTMGIQGFVGYYNLGGDNDHYSYDSYDGMTWRAGAFALFPLNEYTMGMKVGVLFERSKASNSYWGTIKGEYSDCHVEFVQGKVNIPILFTVKHPKSSFMFDIGVQPSFAVMDDFKLDVPSNSKIGGKRNMLSHDYRNNIDWSLVMGLSLRANKNIGFDLRVDWGVSDLYDYFNEWKVDDLSSYAVTVGFSFYLK